MPNLGIPEIVILLVIIAAIAIPVVMRASRRGAVAEVPAPGQLPGLQQPAPTPPDPMSLVEVRDAISERDSAGAVSAYQRLTGLPYAEAQAVVMGAMEPGPNQWGPEGPGGSHPDSGGWPDVPPRNHQ